MKEYHKIETLFVRDEKTHKLLEGVFRNPTVEQCKDLRWVFTEKIDGTNIRIFWDGHKVSFNGRTDNAQLHPDLWKFINDKVCTNEIEQLFEQKFGDKEVYIFGEGYGAGIQKGGGYRTDKSVIVFDVQVNGIFLEYDNVKDIAEMLGFETVPVVYVGSIDNAITLVKNKEFSDIGNGEQPFEGVVGRLQHEMFDRRHNRMIVKIKREDFIS